MKKQAKPGELWTLPSYIEKTDSLDREQKKMQAAVDFGEVNPLHVICIGFGTYYRPLH